MGAITSGSCRLLTNLLDNAIKYTPPGGHIGLTVKRRGRNEIEFTVTDSGQGMTPDLQARVFGLYARGKQPGIGARGLGIGLFLVEQLVVLHEGIVRAYSDGPGQGSVFDVILPLGVPAELTAEHAEVVSLPVTSSPAVQAPLSGERLSVDAGS